MYTLKIDQLWNNHVQSAHVIKQVQVLIYLIAFWLIVDFCLLKSSGKYFTQIQKKEQMQQILRDISVLKGTLTSMKGERNEGKTDTDVISALQMVFINLQIEGHTPYTKHWIYIALCIYRIRLHVHTHRTVVGSTSFYRGFLTDNDYSRNDHISISQ